MLRGVSLVAFGETGVVVVARAAALAVFGWLLTLHPQVGAGRVYAAYGGVYIAASLAWLRAVEGLRPDRWDVLGSVRC